MIPIPILAIDLMTIQTNYGIPYCDNQVSNSKCQSDPNVHCKSIEAKKCNQFPDENNQSKN